MNINSDPFRSISTVFVIMMALLMGLVYGWGRQERIIAEQRHEAAITALTNELNSVRRQLAAAETTIAALEEEVAGKEEAELLTESLLAQFQGMEHEIGELHQQIAQLNGRLAQEQADKAQLEAHRDDLSRQLQNADRNREQAVTAAVESFRNNQPACPAQPKEKIGGDMPTAVVGAAIPLDETAAWTLGATVTLGLFILMGLSFINRRMRNTVNFHQTAAPAPRRQRPLQPLTLRPINKNHRQR